MKNRYKLCLSLLVSMGIANAGMAQTNIGSAAGLLNSLKKNSGDNTRQASPSVQLKVSDSKNFTGKINFQQSGSSSAYVNGELAGIKGSSFYLKVDGNAVEGHIILNETKQAYRYSSDTQGNVSVKPVDIDGVVCIDLENAPQKDTKQSSLRVEAISAVALSLQSLPGANGCIYIDFDGHNMPAGNLWNNGNAINAAPSGMSDAAIQELWEIVSEDYRPYSLNVTTSEAVFNSYAKSRRMRCVVTTTNTAAPGAGGVAYIGSFNWDNDVPCWVFITSGKGGGEATSHEIGHTFGLGHDGRISPAEGYYSGHGDWAPIMGVGYYKPVSQWSKGEFNSANNTEDDLTKIADSKYGVGYRADDYGNSTGAAANIVANASGVVSSDQNKGVIERTGDLDFFAFNTGGGNIALNVNTVGRHGDLDILVRLYNSAGAVIGTFNPAGLNASVTASLGAGKYYISVDGTGAGNPATDGYSEYASIGSFFISGNIPPTVITPTVNGAVIVYKDCSYGGYAVGLEEGEYTRAQLIAKGISDDDISSVKVRFGFKVTVFKDDNLTGTALALTGDRDCLVNDGFNDNITSLSIRTNGVSGLNGTYFIQNKNSSQYIDVADNNTADGAKVTQWAYNGNANQKFSLVELGNGTYKILSVIANKALDVSAISTANGAVVFQYTYLGSDNQKFILVDAGSGYYKLVAKHSGKIIEIGGMSTTAGAITQQWADQGQSSGQWKLVKVSVTPPASSTFIQAENYSNMLGVQTETTTDADGGLNVGYIDQNDWMVYNNITFPAAGTYNVEYRVASLSGSKLSLDLNGGAVQLGSLNVPATGGWQNWTTISHIVTVNAGTYNLGVFAQAGGWNLNWIRITKQSNAPAATAAGLNSTQELTVEQTIKLFPNPASSAVNISSNLDLTGSTATVLDVYGNIVLSVTATTYDNTLDIESLPAGIYNVVIIQTRGNTIKTRFMKQ